MFSKRHIVVTVVGKCRIEQNRVPRQLHHHERLHVVRHEATNARQARGGRCDVPLRHHIRVVGVVPATRKTQSSLHTLDQLHLRAGTAAFYASQQSRALTATRRSRQTRSASAWQTRRGRRAEE